MADLLVVISVAKPIGLPALHGVHEVAGRVLAWGSSCNFDVVSVQDSTEPVDAERIKGSLLTANLRGRERVIVYFCGHGLNIYGEMAWVLSGGIDGEEGLVGVELFKRMLRTYGVQNLSIIGDACQSLSVPGTPLSAILPPGRESPYPPARADTFYASLPGQSAHVVRNQAGSWQPVFSGVLADALTSEPIPPNAVDPQLSDAETHRISSQSLGSYLDAEVELRAATNGLNQCALTITGLRWPKNVYRIDRLRDQDPPESVEGGLDQMSDYLSETGLETYRGGSSGFSEQIFDQGDAPEPMATGPQRIAYLKRTNSEWRMTFWTSFVDKARTEKFRPGTIQVTVDGRTQQPEIRPDRIQQYSVLIKLDTSIWTVLPFYPEAISAVAATVNTADRRARGLYAVGWHDPMQMPKETRIDPNNEWASPEDAMRVLKGFIGNTIRPSEVQATINNYRIFKHVNPIFGIVASYFYRTAGDIESVVRTAGFYVDHRQPIPFDIALLSGARIRQISEGLVIDLPEIPEADHGKNTPDYLWRAAPAKTDCAIAGLVPVFRAGWTYLSGNPALSNLADLAEWLTGSPITAFDSKKAMENLQRVYSYK